MNVTHHPPKSRIIYIPRLHAQAHARGRVTYVNRLYNNLSPKLRQKPKEISPLVPYVKPRTLSEHLGY